MNPSIQFKPTNPRNSTHRLLGKEQLQRNQALRVIRAFLLFLVVSACFALAPAAQAVIPAPDGGYSGANTAEGDAALFSLTTGTSNTAIGDKALFLDITGSLNTAVGANALVNNTTGSNNTGTGFNALAFNEIGSDNTATGFDALAGNGNSGSDNTADGSHALVNNNSGSDNTAIGFQALDSNTTGSLNTANGVNALFNNTTGGNNTANGVAALQNNTPGANNIALGFNAGGNLTIGNNNIDIGNVGVAAESNTLRVGTQATHRRAFIAGISGSAVTGSPVAVNASGQLGVKASSERFKDEIKPMDKLSEATLALKPVTFRYKKDIDPQGVPQFGLVAEEVEKVNPDLVVRDKDGKPYTVRYEAVNAMLLNEFLKAHRKMEEQEMAIGKLKSGAAKQEAAMMRQQQRIEALTAGLQKVSAPLELSKSAPQTVKNND